LMVPLKSLYGPTGCSCWAAAGAIIAAAASEASKTLLTDFIIPVLSAT
jgi:hypothetical protein